jgi:hypothetical protein
MMRPLNRIQPKLPVTAMRTHAILAPLETHWRKATCEEFGCEHHSRGWALSTAGLTEAQVFAAKNSGRKFVVTEDENGAEVLTFEPGQQCFRSASHRIRIERPEFFIARNGDWRGNPDGEHVKPLVFSGSDSWKDSLGTMLDRCRGE